MSDDHGNVKILGTEDDYNALIAEDKLTVLDFFATWCPPCRAIAPQFVQWSKDYPDINFGKIDVDNQAMGGVCQANEIRAMPTFAFYKNGERFHDNVRGANVQAIMAVIEG